MCVYVFLV